VKLAHEATAFRLHSHKVAYGSGSKQQSVTLQQRVDDHNSLWTVLAPLNGQCVRGARIKSGKTIRLKHAATGALLHSHNFASPLSGNQEVSAYEGESNADDHWIVYPNDGEYWMREQSVVFKHAVTGKVRGRWLGWFMVGVVFGFFYKK
jgi:dolichyl-phosphate-mannose--protein O-mannosyl transferase